MAYTRNKKILIIDDEYDIVELVKAVLKTKGYDIITAYDGEEGFAQIIKEHPDLVVADLRMPRMSGLELCRRIRATPEIASTRILVISSLTAGADKPDDFWAVGLGSDDFLPKPFDPLGLLGRVEYLLRKDEYRSSSPDGTGGFARSAATSASSGELQSTLSSPAEVVRTFIESWNSKDFAAEFRSLGDEMLGGLGLRDYIERRMQLHADEQGGETEHHVIDIHEQVSTNVATVDCLREDLIKGVPRRKAEQYTLRRVQSGWKIIRVKSQPIQFTIEKD